MKSPFVRFSRFVRTGLSFATIGLCLLPGCRHVHGWRRACDDHQECAPTVATDSEPRGSSSYEELSLDSPISPDASEPPLVSLSEGDAFELVPRERPEPAKPEPVVESEPAPPKTSAEEPTSVVEAPVVQKPMTKTLDLDEATLPSAESTLPVRELPDPESEPTAPKKPAPTLKDLEDEFFPDQPESPPKLEVPPEPVPRTATDSQPKSEPKPESELKQESEPKAEVKTEAPVPVVEKEQNGEKELAAVESEKATELLKSAPRKEPVRPKEAVPAVPNEVLSLDSYCDGLVFDAQGFGYVSHKDRIVRFSPTGETTVWTTLSSPKGHRVEPEGTHLVCDTERRAVLRLSFDGKVVGTAAKECDGAALRAPFDIAVDPKGGFYFTDPGYVQIKNPIGKLHYVDRSGNVKVVAAKLGYPTGVAFDAERQRLLVAESLSNRVVEFRLSEPGIIESHEVFAQLPKVADSEYHLANLCLDAEGNLYVTQQRTKAVHVFDPQGRPIGRFSTGEVAPSSVALRGADATELFLTGELESRSRNGKVIRLDLGK